MSLLPIRLTSFVFLKEIKLVITSVLGTAEMDWKLK
jgi:hypothetical protein